MEAHDGARGSVTRALRSPALWVAAFGIALLWVRPPLPVDETRYLEVFRESLARGPLLLTLSGEPYAEKPPLLFWLGRVLVAGGLPMAFALRLVPVVSSALVVALVARFARRLELPLATPLAAVLLLPFLVGQMLLFDPLLSLGVWLALDGWVRGREAVLVVGAAVALLAKGPVALLVLAPFLWSFAPLRSAPRPGVARSLGLFVLALVPLAAWALAAAHVGGPEFADALLWERWGGRLVKSADHARPWWFYAPVALFGALPVTALLLRRAQSSSAAWIGRTRMAVLVLLLVFTLISGKQAHYLTPLAPALALLAAAELARAPRTAWLRAGLALELGLLGAVLLAALVLVPQRTGSFSAAGVEWLRGGTWRLTLLPGLVALAWAGLRLRALDVEPARVLRTSFVALALAAVGLHFVAGRLLYPARLAQGLALDAATPLAFLGSSHHGFYELAAGRSPLPKLGSPAEIAPWLAAHPAGRVLVDRSELAEAPPGTRELLRDRLHQSEILLLARAPRE